jgi:hypothetical protein
VTGRLADFFRLVWGLLYWNIRKSWFQLRRGRSPCPCQSPSDSGRAFETACDACLPWSQPRRFRRVCPLLVETPDGLRCSVNTADVRPFWGRAIGAYGGALAGLYLAAALGIFIFLRTVGYPISIVHLVWPGSWHRVGEVRGWFFMERANQAFAAGRIPEGMLYLNNAYEFDPANDTIALTLAQRLQFGQPTRADAIYRRLLAQHPAQREAIAPLWFRSLLARGDFSAVQDLARTELLAASPQASVWLRALLFATRQTGQDAPLRELLASAEPAVLRWHRVLEIELQLRAGQKTPARDALLPPWDNVPSYALYYQISELTALGEGLAAVDLLGRYGPRLDDTARATLLLEAYTALGAPQSRQRLLEALLAQAANPRTIAILAAHLIRHPDASVLDSLFNKITREETRLTDDSLEEYLSLYCVAGVARDWPKMQAIAAFFHTHNGGSRFTLGFAAAFFRGEISNHRISSVLPALPMPLEVHYALLERYPGSRAARTAPAPAKKT